MIVARIARWSGAMALWIVILALLAIVLVPPFLDRRYYDGPLSDHYDGARFFNPDVAVTSDPVTRRGPAILRYLLGLDARPAWPDHVAVTTVDPASLPPLGAGQMRAIRVGHATVLVQVAGLNILTDPIWSDVAGPLGIGPHRVAAPAIAFDRLPRIDLVLVSHNHYDHMDLATLKRLWDRDRPVIVSSLGNERLMASAGIGAKGLDWDQALKMPRATVHVARVHHWSSRWGVDARRALWSGFVVETGAGNLFFAGDTGPGDMRWPIEARRWGPIRLALLPIGAFRFQPGQMVTDTHIGPREAVEAFVRLGATQAIGMHWGTFRLSFEARGTPPALTALYLKCRGIDPRRFVTPEAGVPVDVLRAGAMPPARAATPGCPTPADLRRYP